MSDAPFHPTAHLYDIAYSHFDYERHAATVLGVIRQRCPDAASLLDVACGTGRHLELWAGDIADRAGLDVDPAMVGLARGRLPGVPVHEADMEDFDLGRTFDAVTCLFSSIGYMRTEGRLRRAVAAMARHVAPGGVLVIEPWLQEENLEPPYLRHHTIEQDDLILVRTNTHTVRDHVSRMQFAYVVTTPHGSEFFTEEHEMGLFTPEQFAAALAAAGLEGEWDPVGTWIERGLAIGVRAR